MKRHKALSWKPRLGIGPRGVQTYCAPACGAGCTFDAYIGAKNAARRLTERLGAGWRPVVSENMTWYYYVKRGPLEVWPERGGRRYSCIMSSEPDGHGGSLLWFSPAYYRTPEAAVQAQMRLARSVIRRLLKTVFAAEGGRKR